MERNTLLAIVLSVLVLFGYEIIFVAPAKRAELLKNSQSVANKELNKESTASSSVIALNQEKPTTASENAIISEIHSTRTTVELSNIGASLHKIGLGLDKNILPLAGSFNIAGLENTPFHLIDSSDKRVIYQAQDKQSQITKTFEIQDENLIKVRLEIKNVSEISSLEINKFLAIGIDFSRLEITNKRDAMLDEYSVYAGKKVFRKGSASKFNLKENKDVLVQVKWAGFRDHYRTMVVKPEFETKSYEIKADTEKTLHIFVAPVEQTIGAGQSAVYEFSVFVGPQDIALMKKYNKGFEDIVVFSNWVALDWIAKAIYFTIPFLQSIFKSWGFAIILISIIIYGLTYPLTIKSMMSMRKMQESQPKIAALKEKYKNDAQRLNQEIMELYRREKINPLGGCLPFLLQMPIFVSLYQVLWRSSYFEGKSFLWIKDLSQPDRLWNMPFNLPFLGNELNILPILMAIVMFMQQKLSAKNAVITDETQAMQQKMMTTIFPVFIGFIFYKFASSLSLYFTMFYLFSTITQWKMGKGNTKGLRSA